MGSGELEANLKLFLAASVRSAGLRGFNCIHCKTGEDMHLSLFGKWSSQLYGMSCVVSQLDGS
jgi:hypothetical protein